MLYAEQNSLRDVERIMMMMNRYIKYDNFFKLFFLIVLINAVLSFLPIPMYAQDVKAILNEMPEGDRQALYSLFYQMINNDHFSYTLFGDKPVSLSGDFIQTPIDNILCGMQCGGIFWKNWEIWKKYQSYFPMHNYFLIENQHNESIILINKKGFLRTVDKNLNLFKKYLGENTTSFNLLRKIEISKDFFASLKQNQLLIGVLLGYGKHNSKLFFERDQIRKFIDFEQFPKLPQKVPDPSKQFSSLIEEYDSFRSKLLPFGEYTYTPLMIGSVHFMADPNHKDTKKLKDKYKKLRGKISTIYAKGDFLEITLSQLTSK